MSNRQTQTAELLKLLGEDAAEAVLSHMKPEIASAVRERMENGPVVSLKTKEKRHLIQDFESFFEFAMKAKPADLSVVSEDGEQSGPGADLHGIPAAEGALNAMADGQTAPLELTGDPMADLELLSVHQLAGALETEQPRTVAILMSNIGPELAANVLSFLPDEHRTLVARQLSKEQAAPQVLVDRIARATVQRGASLPAEAPDRRDHIDRLGEVMREVPKAFRMEMLTAIEEENEDMMEELMKKLYRFDDLVNMDSQMIQRILGEVDATTLTTAMFDADQTILDTILGNLSKRARQTIEEELQFQTRVPDSKVKAARESVAELIAKLDQEGE